MNTVIDTYDELRDALAKMREDGMRMTDMAASARVTKSCLSKFISGRSKHLRADIFMRLRGVARSDAQRLRI